MKFCVDPDPTVSRVVFIGVLLFFESLLGSLLVVLLEGEMPTTIQLLTILVVASLTLVSYFLAFLKREEEG